MRVSRCRPAEEPHESNLNRETAYFFVVKKPVREHADAHMTTRVLVRDIMNSPVVTASPDDTLRDIARKMKEEKIGSIVIMEKDKPVGIVTDWDIVSGGVVKDVKPGEIKAKEVMKDIHTIEGQEGHHRSRKACFASTTSSASESSTRTSW